MANAATQRQPAQADAHTETSSRFTERRVAAWIGKALRVEGRIVSTEDLTIDGQVEGSIELGDHSLTIGDGAAVTADLTAKVITISGSVTGRVRATEMVDLRATGTVDGDITAPRFVMAEGATARGKIEAGVRKIGQQP
jgi:cytoskeletal protein CcmA (bactofilin family)